VKILLVPLAIIAFIIFLVVLGAIGLGVAFVLISIARWIWRFVTRADSRRARREARQAQAFDV
jgi:Flp pilus assembly protein TadB